MTDQNTQFMAILTAVGEAKQANANALGIPWIITQMGVGDANGTEPTPSRLQTSLINERRRAPLNQLKVDPDNEAIIIAEQVIPENVGGWWIREIGLYDEDGDLVAVANCPPTFKPELSQGSGRTQLVRLHLLVSSTQNIVLKVDPSVVLATRAYVDSLTVRASQEDAELGEDNGKIATMLRVFQAMRSGAANATELIRGTLRLATAEQAQELTAGDVAITPETLGSAMNAHVLGMGQTWQDMNASRALNVTYTNTTGRTIIVKAVGRSVSTGQSASLRISVDGIVVDFCQIIHSTSAGNVYPNVSAAVPTGSSYVVTTGAVAAEISDWAELR